jgi:Transglycosylase SLT domain/Sel1 repeat
VRGVPVNSTYRRRVLAAAFAFVLNAGHCALAEQVDTAASAPEASGVRSPEDLVALAGRYEYAEGVPRDHAKANALYCEAAKQGYPEAQFKLGWAYANGRGVPHDDGVAALLFHLAAAQGHEYARRLLAYVSAKNDTTLPECLKPDPPPVERAHTTQGSAGLAPVATAAARVPPAIRQLVDRLAPQYTIDTQLALAVIATESGFDEKAVSARNAQGLMQLIPETAARFGVKRVFNPADNIRGGLAYLRWLLAFFRGDVPLVLAAYNAGEGAVEKYRGIPPYPETRNYVDRITRLYRKATHPYEPSVVGPSRIVAGKIPVREARDAPSYD